MLLIFIKLDGLSSSPTFSYLFLPNGEAPTCNFCSDSLGTQIDTQTGVVNGGDAGLAPATSAPVRQ